MSWLKRLFGPMPEKSTNAPAMSQTGRRTRYERPFDYVSDGLEAWEAKDYERTERALRQGIEAYRRNDPADVHFALGRLGAFLVDQGRFDEAARILAEAIAMDTDIPAIWHDYMEVMAARQDIDGLFDAALRSAPAVVGANDPAEIPWEALLAHARRASRAGSASFAQAVARRVVELTTKESVTPVRWAAIGNLGEILERTGELDEALTMWQGAFDEGSNDPATANRLSMHLERRKDFASAIGIIDEALRRKMPANVEEQLRKRLERCRARTERRKRTEVAAFSVKQEF